MRALTIVLLFLLALLQYRLWVGPGSWPDVWQLEREAAAQRAENAQLVDRNKSLEAEVWDLKHGLKAVEERARSEMGMIKKGETFYLIIDPHDANGKARQGSQ